eukprot:74570-Pelagomonas_calceolata.AAC.1
MHRASLSWRHAAPSSALHAKVKCHYRHLLRCTVPHSVGCMPHPPVPRAHYSSATTPLECPTLQCLHCITELPQLSLAKMHRASLSWMHAAPSSASNALLTCRNSPEVPYSPVAQAQH